MSHPYPIIELEVDGQLRHFYADFNHRIVVSIDDSREWYAEEHCNCTIEELIIGFGVTEH